MSLPCLANAKTQRQFSPGISIVQSKGQLAFYNLDHPWQRSDIELSTKGWFYSVVVHSVLLYGSQTGTLKADAQRVSLFDHHCLRSICMV